MQDPSRAQEIATEQSAPTLQRRYRSLFGGTWVFIGMFLALGIAVTSAILSGGVSALFIFMSIAVLSSVVSGFSYLARLADSLRNNEWNRECTLTTVGAVIGVGLSVATAVIGLPDLGYGNVGTVAAGVTAGIANTGAFSGLFNRLARTNRERWVIFGALGVSVGTGSILIGVGFNLNSFSSSLEGLGISGHSIGAIPAEAMFVALLAIMTVAFADYFINKALLGWLIPRLTQQELTERTGSTVGLANQVEFSNTPQAEAENRANNSNAAIGVFFGIVAFTITAILSFTGILPALSIPATVVAFVSCVSCGGGLATRFGRAGRGLANILGDYNHNNVSAYQPISQNIIAPKRDLTPSRSQSPSNDGEHQEQQRRSSQSFVMRTSSPSHHSSISQKDPDSFANTDNFLVSRSISVDTEPLGTDLLSTHSSAPTQTFFTTPSGRLASQTISPSLGPSSSIYHPIPSLTPAPSDQ